MLPWASVRRLLVALLPLTLCALPRVAQATPREYTFGGSAFYLGLGGGFLPELGEGTANLRLFATAALRPYLHFEYGLGATQYTALDHHSERDSTVGGTIFLGLRLSPFHRWAVQPFAALRFTHTHFLPDLWAPHPEGADGGVEQHLSIMRWGGAIALGLDARLGPPGSRFRGGLEAEVQVLSGGGPLVYSHLLGTLGVGF